MKKSADLSLTFDTMSMEDPVSVALYSEEDQLTSGVEGDAEEFMAFDNIDPLVDFY